MNLYLERVNKLIEFAHEVLRTRYSHDSLIAADSVKTELFSELRTSSLSFIRGLYKEEHPFFIDFNKKVHLGHAYEIEIAIGILNSIKKEIENGWLISLKGLVSADIFTDFIEMAEHLLEEGYKDSAAVMIGCVLEEHIRQLCLNYKIDTNDLKGKPKKADLMNSELSSSSIYGRLDQKAITSWLDLRNKAAHGKYTEYNKEQVDLMIRGVIEFMTRIIIK